MKKYFGTQQSTEIFFIIYLIAPMEKDSETFIQIKVAITLRGLLKRIKSPNSSIENKIDLVNSYQKIATNANFNLRKATVTAAFSGKTKSAMTTIITIVISMGYTMKEFGEEYDKISDKQVFDFMSREL
ncbi:hypothetical protein NU10_13715 [Flavobacterium dauae]|uniref:hypothetical protein n=1 Tax=Flavobacterium dauae TaxID=1563479 RepID=UPI00101B4ABA|nr:hypothetical protein [Flavobacterium dauae]WLD23744.1 hypothetical protein NU10_13715 [Flavobacterium dauae]